MAQRNSRKRGRRRKPPSPQPPSPQSTTGRGADPVGPSQAHPPRGTIAGWPAEPEMTRSQRRDAQVRAGLTPLRPGERPGAIVVASLVAGLLGLGNLGAFAAGVKIGGKHPAAGGIIVFSVLMIACAIGMWRLWYGAVLGFMALLAIVATLFALLLIEASNILGLVVGLVAVGGSGYLFFKLVRVLSRIQMPRYPGR